MGGPGFFGIKLESQWLVISIWGAATWIQANGRIVENPFWEEMGDPKPWDFQKLSEVADGQNITKFEVEQHSLEIVVGNKLFLSIARRFW